MSADEGNRVTPPAPPPNEDDELTDEETLDITTYPEGLAGMKKAYAVIQSIFERVASEYPDWFFGASDDEDGGLEGGDTGSGVHKKTLYLRDDMDDDEPTPGSYTEGETGDEQEDAGADEINEGDAPQVIEVIEPVPPIEASPPVAPLQPLVLCDAATSPRRRFPFSWTHDPQEIRHDDFADEFIRTSGLEMTIVTQTCLQEKQLVLRHDDLGDDEVRGEAQSGDDDRNTKATSLKLIYNPPIWPHQESLYKTLSRLPTLRNLILDDSKLKWVRDLGSLLPNLKTLSVMRCSLKSLDGASGLANLEHLFAADNAITDPSPLASCTKLRYLDLSDNQIADMAGFAFLKTCGSLNCLKLMENEVSKNVDFHTEMRRMIPSLRDIRPRILDIHGPDVFDLVHDYENEAGPSVPPPSRGISKGEDFEGLGGLTEEARRLRDVFNPGRVGYKKRVMTSIPQNVDEMDALLEELEGAESGDPLVINLKSMDKLFGNDESAVQGDDEPGPTTPGGVAAAAHIAPQQPQLVGTSGKKGKLANTANSQ